MCNFHTKRARVTRRRRRERRRRLQRALTCMEWFRRLRRWNPHSMHSWNASRWRRSNASLSVDYYLSGPGGAVGPVCVCVWTVTVELEMTFDLWCAGSSRHFLGQVRRSNQSSWLQEETVARVVGCDLEWGLSSCCEVSIQFVASTVQLNVCFISRCIMWCLYLRNFVALLPEFLVLPFNFYLMFVHFTHLC